MSARTTRRAVLATTGVGTLGALAGCLGDTETDVDDGTIRMQTSSSGTAAYSANQGIAEVVNSNVDDLFVEAQTSNGTEQNIGDLASRDAEMVYIQNWSAREINEGVEPFDQLDYQPAQVFHFYDLPWFFCTDHDLETLSDIESGMAISPTPRGAGTAPALEHALSYAIDEDEYDRVSVDFGEQGSSLNENQLDVGMGTYHNFDFIAGWLQEMAGTAELTVLGVSDSTVEEWENDDRLLIESFDGAEIAELGATPDEVHCPTFAYNFISRAELEYDTVYGFLETMYENRDELEQYHSLLNRHTDETFWVENMYTDLPFHDAAADFYEEIGVWDDEFERADVQ